jgi:hypothetical protein
MVSVLQFGSFAGILDGRDGLVGGVMSLLAGIGRQAIEREHLEQIGGFARRGD